MPRFFFFPQTDGPLLPWQSLTSWQKGWALLLPICFLILFIIAITRPVKGKSLLTTGWFQAAFLIVSVVLFVFGPLIYSSSIPKHFFADPSTASFEPAVWSQFLWWQQLILVLSGGGAIFLIAYSASYLRKEDRTLDLFLIAVVLIVVFALIWNVFAYAKLSRFEITLALCLLYALSLIPILFCSFLSPVFLAPPRHRKYLIVFGACIAIMVGTGWALYLL